MVAGILLETTCTSAVDESTFHTSSNSVRTHIFGRAGIYKTQNDTLCLFQIVFASLHRLNI